MLQSLHHYKPQEDNRLTDIELIEFNNIEIDSKGNAWVSCNVGIFKIDKETEDISYFYLKGNYFPSFTFDTDNNFYGTNFDKLFVFADIEHKSPPFIHNFTLHNNPANITKIKSHNNKIWFVSNTNGLFIYDKKKFYSSYNQNVINTNGFSDICFDNSGNCIAGGINGKIYITEFWNDSITSKFEISKNNGLKGSSIRWLNCTNNNILIVGTNEGLNLINLNKLYNKGILDINTINKSNGFIGYSGENSIIDKNGSLWIGSNSKLYKIDLGDLKKTTNSDISFYIKSVEVNDKQFDLEKFVEIDPWTNIPKSVIKLPYSKNSITFNYDVVRFMDNEEVNFSYKLEGYHQNWSKQAKEKKAVFQNLKPGNYRLRIKVSYEDGSDTSQELSISFRILSPFWFKWWFIHRLRYEYL